MMLCCILLRRRSDSFIAPFLVVFCLKNLSSRSDSAAFPGVGLKDHWSTSESDEFDLPGFIIPFDWNTGDFVGILDAD